MPRSGSGLRLIRCLRLYIASAGWLEVTDGRSAVENKKPTIMKRKLLLLTSAIPLVLVACSEKTTTEEVGATKPEAVEELVDQAAKAAEDAAADVEEAAEAAVNEVEEVADEAAQAVREAVEEASTEEGKLE